MLRILEPSPSLARSSSELEAFRGARRSPGSANPLNLSQMTCSLVIYTVIIPSPHPISYLPAFNLCEYAFVIALCLAAFGPSQRPF